MKKPNKKTFSVVDFGSIDQCLQAMEAEGYRPVRRKEEPVFKEGKQGPEYVRQNIAYEGRLIKSEQ
ncbi:NETI motif-containing protein [Tuberibacillus sp. Marseille-P3662]|uniref:NETI motif-containing protein n=1 Tax=Tuberibacillus sp. Marseille-P3662 TaxID=1965358 RepID=UPI000A1CD7ED|nr:NETI motif-containing protein [Tuberibacillus sp. Marseille-P3662]